MAEKENIQEVLLEKFKSDGTELTVFLLNGFQMKGKIVNFDDNVVLLDIQGKENLIYKHAISTFVDTQDEENKDNE
ncbi:MULTISPECIES: RNA chaperone Hfq [Mammaliicoccus]|uniref:RNA-binding protein Hfq n=1 Tax=Mammaliicoccus fleurettii TaxID=150056 RepID=A0ABS5MRF9_9STAP|nr:MULTISPECIES: RNA chaperone Hfq [Mammaliicoccus]HCN59626.1 RNA chaperone Hfq [Staphylococcus sp.]MBL0848438.1 RNA chaperone Hfq [Mammaliicoccus fleurettii]MBO3062672.1 RNA chaperone Hfq [Mammaliicoccus fleurettii]MBS3672804.1 RNA chaperone Hfq [Mammaliicoccus fleurettii]MBS3698252.1 RNA chaperone Hfq [Mammaliicoccus fleurettii]